MCCKHKNVRWWDLSHIQKKTENVFLTKIGDAFTLKNRDVWGPVAGPLSVTDPDPGFLLNIFPFQKIISRFSLLRGKYDRM